jgi:hypothetical protein
VLRVLRLTLAAARADGTLEPRERDAILTRARELGAEPLIAAELDAPRPIAEIVGGVSDPQTRQDLYTLAFAVVRADESLTDERAHVAHGPCRSARARCDNRGEAGAARRLAHHRRGRRSAALMSSAQWFMALSGRQVGPMPEQEVIANIENGTADGNTLVFTAGMTNWAPISTVPQFVPYLKGRRDAASAVDSLAAGARRTRSTSRSSARTCSSSRWSSIPAKAPWPRPAR